MNIDNGHLIRLSGSIGIADMERAFADMMNGPYRPVPEELQPFAEEELAGKNETYIDLKAATPLATWAAKKRSERDKKKDKRNMVKKSKQRNRA